MPHDIGRSALLQREALECLLSWLVEQAPNAMAEADEGREPASNEEIVDAVQQVRHQGGHEVHQQLQDSLEDTRNPKDMLTFEEIATAIEANGESPPPHAEIGKQIRRLWPLHEVHGPR